MQNIAKFESPVLTVRRSGQIGDDGQTTPEKDIKNPFDGSQTISGRNKGAVSPNQGK